MSQKETRALAREGRFPRVGVLSARLFVAVMISPLKAVSSLVPRGACPPFGGPVAVSAGRSEHSDPVADPWCRPQGLLSASLSAKVKQLSGGGGRPWPWVLSPATRRGFWELQALVWFREGVFPAKAGTPWLCPCAEPVFGSLLKRNASLEVRGLQGPGPAQLLPSSCREAEGRGQPQVGSVK